MFPSQFSYLRVASADEAVDALAKHGGDARILAGGQSLIPAMRYRLARPSVLIDINAISALSSISEPDGYLALGACARDFAMERSSTVQSQYPLLADAAAVVADPVVRQTGTVVGSLCHNDPAGDWPVVALAARAEIDARGKSGLRTISIDDFLVDSYTTALAEDEMAISIRFPKARERSSGAYYKIERKVGDFSTASAAVSLRLAADGSIEDAGVAVGAVGAKAIRVIEAEKALRGAKPSRDLVRTVMAEASRVADPVADNRGSVEYKKEMAGVLAGRALVKTLQRLGVGGLQ